MAESKPRLEQANGPRITIVTWNPERAYREGGEGKYDALKKIFSKLLFDQISTSTTFLCEQEVAERTVLNTSKEENLNSSFSEKTTVFSPLPSKEIPIEFEGREKFRCSGQLVTHNHQATEIKFILISFHGHNSKDDKKDIKIKKIGNFIEGMIKLANANKKVVIVGGCFNIEVIEWKSEIEEKYCGQVVVAPIYAGVPNRRHAKMVIDTFIAVHPDKSVLTCTFDTPIPIYMLPAKGYIGDDETKFLNYPNDVCPYCKVLYYNNKELQELKETIMEASSNKPNFEESYKDNTTDAIFPLWPRCKFLEELNHDPVMVTVEFITKQSTSSQSQLTSTPKNTFSQSRFNKSEECQTQDIVETIKHLDLGQDDDETSEKQTITAKAVQEKQLK